MYNFSDAYASAVSLIVAGLLIFILMPLCSIKDKKNRKSLIIFGIIGGSIITFIGMGDLVELKNPNLEVYIGEYVDYDVSGKNAVGEYTFDSHRKEDFKLYFQAQNFLDIWGNKPELGKWYEIHYLADSTYRTIVKVEEVPPPDYYKESSKTE
ncbi:MAG: hypothetical protein IJ306_01330 [Oscillospiraceae bacterium]|nr:hypothetical protein [Oscillospiraceae bacterium]